MRTTEAVLGFLQDPWVGCMVSLEPPKKEEGEGEEEDIQERGLNPP